MLLSSSTCTQTIPSHEIICAMEITREDLAQVLEASDVHLEAGCDIGLSSLIGPTRFSDWDQECLLFHSVPQNSLSILKVRT